MGFPDFTMLYGAWRQCRRRKQGTPQAQRYETRLLDNLVDTAEALASGSWSPARPVCFTVDRPKAREIHAAAFSDRVVHHWLVPRLEVLYEPLFIHDVYSNRKGRGTHAAVERLQSFMHSLGSTAQAAIASQVASDRPATGSHGYFLQLDIANFFVSIDRRILFDLLQKRLGKAVRQGRLKVAEAEKLRWACHRILKQDVGREARVLATPVELRRVPPHKRLANAGPDKGLPIGNLTSQFFANVYLNELDQFVKHSMKCRHYLRYVDDMVLLHHNPAQLERWHREIADFLQQRLALRLRPRIILAPVSQGVDFLGYIVRPHYRLVRRRVLGNLHEKLQAMERQLIRGAVHSGRILHLDSQVLAGLRACLASYLGHFRHAHCSRLMVSVWRRWPWLGLLFGYARGRLLPLWEPASVAGYRGQVAYFRKRYPAAQLCVQRGAEVDVFIPTAGVPDGAVRNDRQSVLRHAVRQVNVIEDGYLKGGLKRRVIHALYFEPGVCPCRI